MSDKVKKIMGKYSIFAPIIRKNVRKQEEIIGRKFTREERNQFIEKNTKSLRTRTAVVAGILGVGLLIGVKATEQKSLPSPKPIPTPIATEQPKVTDTPEKKKEERNSFKIELQEKAKQEAREQAVNETKNENEFINELVNEYNSRYDKDIEEQEVGVLKLTPNFIRKDKDTSEYYMGKENSPEDELIDKQGSPLYVVVNNRDNTIISGVIKENSKVKNVQVKSARDKNNTEYVLSKETLNLTRDENGNEKSDEEKEQIYNNLEEAQKQIEKAYETNDYEIDER